MDKKKKILVYVASMIVPLSIFFVAAWINGFVPFGKEMLNSYDSFSQYPGMLLEYARLLRGGNIFYSWGAGLGFNFLGTLTYYGMSPLNLFSLLANPQNYHIFIAIMTYVRFMLLGGTMCFYLSHKKIPAFYIILFSTIYALMGYTSTYYYNYIWIDSVIMLPLVIHGLDRLLEGKSPLFYMVTLTLTIIINYYIGYMICIFCLIWFLYNIIHIENPKKIISTFIVSSLLSGLMSAVVILPSFFALMTGKADLYNRINYFGISRNAFTFFYSLTPGAYQAGDQTYGPALIYVTIFTVVLAVFYFFNKKFQKREKIATLIVIALFYLSFGINFINYAWQLFQKPIWWQSRFSFVFSFFLITVAYRTLVNIDKTEFPRKWRILLCLGGIIAVLVGAYFKWQVVFTVETYTYIYLGLSILLMIEMFAFLDKKSFLPMLIIFTLVELSLNTYNSLKNNFRSKSYTDYQYVKDEVPLILDKLNKDNDNFFRFELTDDFTSDDGLYFGYHGINYFNSVRNIAVGNLLENLGVMVYDKCHIELLQMDPVVLSLLDVKYLYGMDIPYFDKIDSNLHENPYALGLGFLSKSDIASVSIEEGKPAVNKENILKALTGLKKKLYEVISIEKFTEHREEDYTVFRYSFTSTTDLLLMPEFEGTVTVGDESYVLDETRAYADYKGKIEMTSKNGPTSGYLLIEKDEPVTVEYHVAGEYEDDEIFLSILDMDVYCEYMEMLAGHEMKSQTNTSPTTILEATITSDSEHDYLFTSIEYERGMKVFVDGNQVEPDIVLGTLIGLPLGEGKHEIKIKYVPYGLYPGVIISLSSLVVSVFYLQRRKKVI